MHTPSPDRLHFAGFTACRTTGELARDGQVERLEPKVSALLFLLAGAPGRVFTRDEIIEALWPGVIVSDESVARVVSRLRKALGEDARAASLIETLPKRGYRFLGRLDPPPGAPVLTPVPGQADLRNAQASSAVRAPSASTESLAHAEPVLQDGQPAAARWGLAAAAALVLVAAGAWLSLKPGAPEPSAAPTSALVERGNDLYFRYTRSDNESAIALFERVIELEPANAAAHASLANALAQRVLRWPPSGDAHTQLGEALAAGHLQAPSARTQLAHALLLAQRAVELAPDSAEAHKAHGFVLSVREEFEDALVAYRRAIALDPDAWGAMINVGDVLQITGRPDAALTHFEQAFHAMARAYAREPARVLPWHADVGLLVGDRHAAAGRSAQAREWYRRVLEIEPSNEAAVAGLARASTVQAAR